MELEAEKSGVHCQPSYSNSRYSFFKKKRGGGKGKTKNPARMLLAISRVDDSRVEEGVLGLKHTWKPAELEKCEQ